MTWMYAWWWRRPAVVSGASRQEARWGDVGTRFPATNQNCGDSLKPKPIAGWSGPRDNTALGLSSPWWASNPVSTSTRSPAMNKYGLMARDHWQLHAPRQYEELTNPEEFFTRLGEDLADEITRIVESQTQALPPSLPYWEKTQQLMRIQRQAEEIVLKEQLWTVHEPSLDPETRLEEILDQLPSPTMVTSELRQLDDQVARNCEENRVDFGYTQVEQLHREQLLHLRDLLVTAENPNLSWKERLQAAEQASSLSSTPAV